MDVLGVWAGDYRVVSICGKQKAKDEKESAANCFLIAAAPDMLEALENARETIDYLRQYVAGQGLSAEGDCDDILEAINAALSKAQTGGYDERKEAQESKGDGVPSGETPRPMGQR